MLGTVLNTSLTLFYLVGIIISILMRKLKFRETENFTQDHVANKWQSQHSLSVAGASFPHTVYSVGSTRKGL